MELEDELGDILEKARDGKSWSQADLAENFPHIVPAFSAAQLDFALTSVLKLLGE